MLNLKSSSPILVSFRECMSERKLLRFGDEETFLVYHSKFVGNECFIFLFYDVFLLNPIYIYIFRLKIKSNLIYIF